MAENQIIMKRKNKSWLNVFSIEMFPKQKENILTRFHDQIEKQKQKLTCSFVQIQPQQILFCAANVKKNCTTWKAFDFSQSVECIIKWSSLCSMLSLPKTKFHNVSWKLILFRVRNSTKKCHLLLITNSFVRRCLSACVYYWKGKIKIKIKIFQMTFERSCKKCVYFFFFFLMVSFSKMKKDEKENTKAFRIHSI